MNIAVVGLGLIGGSICKALKENTSYSVYGIDINDIVKQTALKSRAVDYIIQPDELKIIDVCFLCLYPKAAVDFAKENIKNFKKGCIITDVCGVKRYMEKELDAFLYKKGMYYVGGHPMTGKENSGFNYSDGKIFNGANYILTLSKFTDKNAFDIVNDIIISFGCNVIVTDSVSHDKIIAYTSQLAHIVSSSYVKSPTIEFEKGFTGGSFQDMTRVALLNEEMWADLFLLNKDNLTKEIKNIIQQLKNCLDAIENGDKTALHSLLKEGKSIKKKHLN